MAPPTRAPFSHPKLSRVEVLSQSGQSAPLPASDFSRQMSKLKRPLTLHRCVKFPDEGCGASAYERSLIPPALSPQATLSCSLSACAEFEHWPANLGTIVFRIVFKALIADTLLALVIRPHSLHLPPPGSSNAFATRLPSEVSRAVALSVPIAFRE